MLHFLPLQPEAQEQVFGPTHLPLFMHTGSHTPATHGVTLSLCTDSCTNCAHTHKVMTHSFDTSSLCSLQGRSTRCFSCSGLHSYRGGCTQLQTARFSQSCGLDFFLQQEHSARSHNAVDRGKNVKVKWTQLEGVTTNLFPEFSVLPIADNVGRLSMTLKSDSMPLSSQQI